ncbi:MAG: metal-dependent phosphohydrolase [Candidatus Pseudobacter hemicellulosilyticus]|uniref:Metal-dependent phosphohydrolase n=1 Tax=Candidatus Pseudobacter hemicellulosilyticus TaxID=3121375 RepID=A0AAJ5WNW3_9BACT|nr:MAG: metal-dependent phosphohydrolase [Pseudobacter sp.]
MEKLLEKITAYADKAHGDQRRKYRDERYINHPIRVMGTVKTITPALPLLAASLLHDVVEDTEVSSEALLDFLLTVMDIPTAIQTQLLVTELTDVYTKASYPRLNRRQRKAKEHERLSHASAAAQTIKYADLIDNGTDVVGMDPDFAKVYLLEAKDLLQKMDMGNPVLRKQAEKVVIDGLAGLTRN